MKQLILYPAFEMEVPILVKEIGNFEMAQELCGHDHRLIEHIEDELEEREIPLDDDLVTIFKGLTDFDSHNLSHAAAYYLVEVYSLNKERAKKAKVLNDKYENK